MGKSIRLAFILVTLFIISNGILQGAPFSDLSDEHWAYEALDMLQEKGFLEGYPDGFFKA